MCPSYIATGEELHSTRGRAHLLWELMQGEVLPKQWKNEQVRESLDLCLSCKACKSECPVSVDMATYKAEFLAHHYEGGHRPSEGVVRNPMGLDPRRGCGRGRARARCDARRAHPSPRRRLVAPAPGYVDAYGVRRGSTTLHGCAPGADDKGRWTGRRETLPAMTRARRRASERGRCRKAALKANENME